MNLIEQLRKNRDLSDEGLRMLIEGSQYEQELSRCAAAVRREHYGDKVYIRGLIEISNHCKNNCFYCGIRRDNKEAERYRLTKDELLDCCKQGYELGFRTFVLQGGDDAYFTDSRICEIVSEIKSIFPSCAVTLSLGEKTYESYKAYFEAGADRYLLRHETANRKHYEVLHPDDMNFEKRMDCLRNLKKIGYQTGSGFMVGSPHQTTEFLIEDLRFLQKLQPDMIGIGPYISHKETPFAEHKNGNLHTCIRLISILRLMFPYALIPATTALGTIAENGREMGLIAGANVVMPNLSPVRFRQLYALYNDKICTGEEAAEGLVALSKKVAAIGYEIVTDVGNVKR